MKINAYIPSLTGEICLGEVVGYENTTLFVQQEEDKHGRKPVLAVTNYEERVIIKEE